MEVSNEPREAAVASPTREEGQAGGHVVWPLVALALDATALGRVL